MIDALVKSRRNLPQPPVETEAREAEGGCGVVGFISTKKLKGKYIHTPCRQMRNRGNGKGGGVLAVGLSAEQMKVTDDVLHTHYLLQIAYLNPKARQELEEKHIRENFQLHSAYRVDSLKKIPGLEITPPVVWRYFVRVKPGILKKFRMKHKLKGLDARSLEDEFVYQNSVRINDEYYASLGDKTAFVLSHGRNMFIFKIVGYAEEAVKFYKLDETVAHVWVGHQRYPTKGRVWHPGGAHPFIGLNEGLIHNGDFANYYSVCEYLKQRNIRQQFLTDTEVSVQLFDLWDRVYQYPLEYIIESLAPTTERDFEMLPEEKKRVYKALQSTNIHASPDGPWFFIIGRSKPDAFNAQLIGITDTSMLRPQVFAIQEGKESIGLIASEKQAIDATLKAISVEDSGFCPIADRYWNARGGSHTDGGSFIFTVSRKNSRTVLSCTDKFGNRIQTQKGQHHFTGDLTCRIPLKSNFDMFDVVKGSRFLSSKMRDWSFEQYVDLLCQLEEFTSKGDDERAAIIKLLTAAIDHRFNTGSKKRSSLIALTHESLYRVFRGIPKKSRFKHVTWKGREKLKAGRKEEVVVVDASGFPAEGDNSLSHYLVKAYGKGYRNFVIYNMTGQRFIGCGLGPTKEKVTIDVYGSSGDYLASGMCNIELRVHNNAQDQLGQIMKGGKLVVHGDVGQTLLYGAKGGEIYVLGNAAGRPMINAVGSPKLILNGTALDYMAESFMAGDPHKGGGFVVINGVFFDESGILKEMPTPYPGSNLFSLASGGAIYVRDPNKKLSIGQLNGGRFAELSDEDWELILKYLKENERLFGITVDELLSVNGVKKRPYEVYRKIEVVADTQLMMEQEQ